jgi:hypothetical protein
MQVRIFFLFSAMLMRGADGKFNLMRVGCLTGIRRLRAPMEVILF